MPLSPTSAPIELHEILVNLGVLIVAVGSSIAGIWQGFRKAKKLFNSDVKDDQSQDKKRVISAAIMETVSMREFTEQNRISTEQTRLLCNRIEELIDELRDDRSTRRDLTDEARKLRLAVSDLAETNRTFNR